MARYRLSAPAKADIASILRDIDGEADETEARDLAGEGVAIDRMRWAPAEHA